MRVTAAEPVPWAAPGQPSPPVIDVRDAQVAIDGHPILRGVSLRVRPGEIVALLGANGSGKTTLVRALVGLVPLTAGQVTLFGTDIGRFSAWRRLGYVPQRTTATSGAPATVSEVVRSGRLSRTPWWRPLNREDRAAVDEALAEVGLSEHASASVASLSGGQQQRVLLARALAGRPEVLILDEPLAGVDLPSQEAFAATLSHLRGSGTTVLMVAHELGPLAATIERAVVLRRGRVAHEGAPPAPAREHADRHHDHVHPHAPAEAAEAPRWLS